MIIVVIDLAHGTIIVAVSFLLMSGDSIKYAWIFR